MDNALDGTNKKMEATQEYLKNNVLNVKKKNKDEIIFEGICENEIQQTVENYFDLNRNYEKKKRTTIKKRSKYENEY